MNFATITITTTEASDSTTTLSVVDLFDLTKITLDISNIYSNILPQYIYIDWGDGSEVLEPSIKTYRDYRVDSIIDEVLKGLAPPFLTTPYTHIYKPSATDLVKSLTLKVGIQYVTGEATTINVPINVRSTGFYENISDIKLVDTNILNNNELTCNYVFETERDNYIVEINNES